MLIAAATTTTTIEVPTSFVWIGLLVCGLLGLGQAFKLYLDIRRGLSPQPSYEERFASKTEVADLRHELDTLETRFNKNLDLHFARIEATLQTQARSLNEQGKAVNAELQQINRALGRLEGGERHE